MTTQNHPTPLSPLYAQNAPQLRRVYYLSGQRLLRLARADQTIEILMGTAWVTMGGEDIILKAGDRLHVTPGSDDALVSSVQQKRLALAVTP